VRVTVPIDLGMWRIRGGQRRRLTWDPDTGIVALDGDPLAVCTDEDDFRRRLDGWLEHCDLADGLGWVAQQLEGCR
jgi:hypothetical protein